jgi:transcriptional regulator with GAF, ATPase, and Fis domain
VLRFIEQISETSVNALITGEMEPARNWLPKPFTTTARARATLVAQLRGADSLVESELFGIEKGVATGVEQRIGKFEAADGGTLFLDEIGDLSLRPGQAAPVLRKGSSSASAGGDPGHVRTLYDQ